jgi:anti-sigma factor RsiW
MTQYVGCHHARTLLEGLIDGELSMADQLAVESHLRWCDTCALRVEDMRTIGDSLRAQSGSRSIIDAVDDSLTALTEGLLVRVRAERDESLRSRMREMLTDRRLLWPALGATSAVLLCVAAAFSVLHASISRTPESLAAMISAIGSPGSIQRPLRPADNGISIPRLSHDEVGRIGQALELMPEDDVIYAVRTVVGRDGSVADWEILLSDEGLANSKAQDNAVLNAVRKTRFMPAQTPMGQAVAVDVVLVIAKTTAVTAPVSLRNRAPVEVKAKEITKPPAAVPAAPPLSGQPAEPDERPSATA